MHVVGKEENELPKNTILYNDIQMHNYFTNHHTPLHVSTLLCHPQEVRKLYPATLQKYVKRSSW